MMKKLLSLIISLLIILSLSPCALAQLTEYTSGAYTYTVENGKATITYADESISGDVVIPEALGGHTVTAIGNSAFEWRDGITSVSFPSTLTHIGTYAFYGCERLDGLLLHSGIDYIGENAFYGTAHYKNEENWDSGVLYIGAHLIKARDTLSGEYKIKNGTLTVAGFAFSFCEELESISLPEGLKTIGRSAFSYCTKLKSVNIPKRVTFIGLRAFARCEGLEAIVFDAPSGWSATDIDANKTSLPEGELDGASAVKSLTESYLEYDLTRTLVCEHEYSNPCDSTCNVCGDVRDASHEYTHTYFHGSTHHWKRCTVCGEATDKAPYSTKEGACLECGRLLSKISSLDENAGLDADDAIYLLYNVFFGAGSYPVAEPCDFDADGELNASDAIYLLYNVFFGDEAYPLT